MTQPINPELERRFAEHNISKQRLYPWWYRLYRRLGLKPKPPILFTLADHYLYEGTSIAVVFLFGCLISWYFLTTPLPALLPIFAMIFLIPMWNWWGYRRLRRRIGI